MEKMILWLKSEAQQREILEEVRERYGKVVFKQDIQVKSEKSPKDSA